jgi:transposase
LVEGKPISIGNVAYVMGMAPKKLHRWYKDVLSGFTQAREKEEIGKDDLQVIEQGNYTNIPVPILEQKNIGTQMAVDEKTINGTCYTVLSNRNTGKIALMAATTKTEHLMKIINRFDIEKRMGVKSLSRDMAQHYDWMGRQAFMNAYHVIDKFHVIKNIMEQLQAVRIRYRQQELGKRREAAQNNQTYTEATLPNGDTVLQLLARSRGLLFLMHHQWNEQQKQRAKILFEKYPEIKKAYQFVQQIRRWFVPPPGKVTYQKTRNRKKQQLLLIIKDYVNTGIEELKNIAFMLKRNIPQILHYFIAKETNAKAEALNQNLQRFINSNYGTRNMLFFLFRIKIYFA